MSGKSSRQISLVDKITLNWNTKNIYKNAITLGNVDNDENKDIELVIGSIDGELAIFKESNINYWKKCSNLGLVIK